MSKTLFCKFNPKCSFPRRGSKVVLSNSLPPAQSLAHSKYSVSVHWPVYCCLWVQVGSAKEIQRQMTEWTQRDRSLGVKTGRNRHHWAGEGAKPPVVWEEPRVVILLLKRRLTVNSPGWRLLVLKLLWGSFLFFPPLHFYILKVFIKGQTVLLYTLPS